MGTDPVLPAVLTVAETGSTQADLLAVAHDVDGWPHLSGIRAVRQRAGRGRLDRTWQTDTLTALTASLVVRPDLPASALGWVPVLVGAAVADAVSCRGAPASVKWPNDVVVAAPDGLEVDGWGGWRKVAGILGQAIPGGGLVVGIGVNLDGVPPVPWASTLASVAVHVDAETLLDDIRSALARALATDPEDWPVAVGRRCVSIGAQVRAHLPGGEVVEGRATGLDASGGLIVRDEAGVEHLLLAADVEHLRTRPRATG